MINAIQTAYYLRAMNPSETESLIQIASECGLDVEQFTADLASDNTEQTLMTEVSFARRAPIRGFPSLVLDVKKKQWSITLDYKDHQRSLSEINYLLSP